MSLTHANALFNMEGRIIKKVETTFTSALLYLDDGTALLFNVPADSVLSVSRLLDFNDTPRPKPKRRKQCE